MYKLVFELIIPVYKTTKKIKTGFREMHARMQEEMNQQQNSRQSSPKTPDVKERPDEYIDFEEIK